MATKQELAQSIRAYSALSEEQLLAELGRRVQELETAPLETMPALASATLPPPDTSVTAGPFADKLREIGERFLKRFNRSLYNLMCNPQDPDNAKIKNAVLTGGETAGLLLAGALLAQFAWLPGIVTLVASLVLKRFAGAAYDTACETWAEQLK